jgi:hypothetical protein
MKNFKILLCFAALVLCSVAIFLKSRGDGRENPPQLAPLFTKNFPLYEVRDHELWLQIKNTLTLPSHFSAGDGRSNEAGLWAMVVVHPSDHNPQAQDSYRLWISGSYMPDGQEELIVSLEFTQIEVETDGENSLTITNRGEYRHLPYLRTVFELLHRQSGVAIPLMTADSLVSAPPTVSWQTLHDDALHTQLMNTTWEIQAPRAIPQHSLVTVFVYDKKYAAENKRVYQVELMDTKGLIKVSHRQEDRQNHSCTIDVLGYRDDLELWKRLVRGIDR